MANLSNLTKASFLNFNIKDRERITRNSCMTVQNYSYRFSRNINAYGRAYGNSSGGVVTVVLRVGTRNVLTDFYERLKQVYPSSFTLLFNSVFDENGVLTDYDGCMVVDGYIVNVEEAYDRRAADEEGCQMSVQINILMSKVSYQGVNDTLDMTFTS